MKKIIVFSCVAGLLSACGGKPSGIPDEFYQEYQLLGAPKILFRCGDRIYYSAGIGANATYNRIVSDEQAMCSEKFSILESEQ